LPLAGAGEHEQGPEAVCGSDQQFQASLIASRVWSSRRKIQTRSSHAIRMAAFNTATTLAREVRTNTGYARGEDEGHTLIRQALTHSRDIDLRRECALRESISDRLARPGAEACPLTVWCRSAEVRRIRGAWPDTLRV
jgi:hypothetical protein